MKKFISLMLCLCLLLAMLPMGALAAEKPVYLALGDSITTGYGLGDDEPSFTEILADIQGYELVNLGVDGNTAAGIRAQVESGEIDDEIASAELITITCGGNDMLDLVYAKAAASYNASYDPDITADDVVTILANSQDDRFNKLALAAMNALNGNAAAGIPPFVQSEEFFAAVSEYAGNVDTIMFLIDQINPDATVIITTQYNPYKDFTGMFASVAQQIDLGIQQLNAPITHPDSGHTYADVYAAFNEVGIPLCNATSNPLNLDFHPNAAGHEVIAATILALLEPAVPSNPFTDVNETHYFYDPVLWALESNITTGATDTTFAPFNETERCQIVTFLWRAKGSPMPTSAENPFSDVKETDYFYNAVLWAVENGITTGTSETTFSPFNQCERGQVVTFLWRAEGSPAPTSANNPFTDVNESHYFYNAVLWAVENGITSGATDTTFAPFAITQRCQAVTFLYRALN